MKIIILNPTFGPSDCDLLERVHRVVEMAQEFGDLCPDEVKFSRKGMLEVMNKANERLNNLHQDVPEIEIEIETEVENETLYIDTVTVWYKE